MVWFPGFKGQIAATHNYFLICWFWQFKGRLDPLIGSQKRQMTCNWLSLGLGANPAGNIISIPVIPFDIVNDFTAEVFVPPAIKQEAKLIYLQQVARRRLIVCARKCCELDDGRHRCSLDRNRYGTKLQSYSHTTSVCMLIPIIDSRVFMFPCCSSIQLQKAELKVVASFFFFRTVEWVIAFIQYNMKVPAHHPIP